MSFSDTPAAVTSELARALRTYPSVVAADCIAADETPSGRPEIDCVIEATARGTLPNAVTHAVCRSSLGIADVTDANAIRHKRVVVR
jgi:hypothetical protein